METDWLFRVCMCTACQAGPAAMRPAPARRQDPARPVGCPAPRTAWSAWVARPRRARSWRSTARAKPQLTLRPPRPASAAHRPGTSGPGTLAPGPRAAARSRGGAPGSPAATAAHPQQTGPMPPAAAGRRVLDDTADGAPTPWSTPTAPAATVSAHNAASRAGGSVAIGRQPSACSARSARSAARSIRSAVRPASTEATAYQAPRPARPPRPGAATPQPGGPNPHQACACAPLTTSHPCPLTRSTRPPATKTGRPLRRRNE